MHYTRRLLDRRWPGALVAGASFTLGVGAASCSSSDDELGQILSPDAGAADAGSADTSPPEVVDAGADREAAAAPFDGGLLPVTCESTKCATSLVTTRGASATDYAEGFCALLQDRTVACWGAGGSGQLGRGADAGPVDSATPARIEGLQNIVSLDRTCAVDEAGAAYCWGTGPFLRDPAVAKTTELAPVKLDLPPATKLSVGYAAGCAVTSGDVVCWGSNVNGQVALFKTELPTAVLSQRPVSLPPGAPIEDLVVGNASFAIRADRSVVTWGANPPLARVSSLFPDPNPLPSVLAEVMSLDVADDNACAAAAGVGYCWGSPSKTPQNTEPHMERGLPIPVVAPEPLVQIATTPTVLMGRYNNETQPRRWCAVAVSGAVYCWGYNTSGQAGDGTKDHAYEAVKVVGLSGPAAQVKTTPNSTCALLTSGKIYCWGTNYYGQLGNGEIKRSSLSPQEVVLP